VGRREGGLCSLAHANEGVLVYWEDNPLQTKRRTVSRCRVRSADPILALFGYLDNRTGDIPLWGIICPGGK
jgi:hypothetical protein